MTSNVENDFISKAKKEIQRKIKNEQKSLDTLNIEYNELKNAIVGYSNFYDELCNFISESVEDFQVSEEELSDYFRSNINEVHQNYLNIKQDAKDEINVLEKYLEKNKKDLNSTKRTLKFYRSQYLDSDFFDECLPLVELYQEIISKYEENEKNTLIIIEKLNLIIKKLENWN